ncbi:MAG: T9SS type A sorting domain-containing protein [Bacteroidales bacterium]
MKKNYSFFLFSILLLSVHFSFSQKNNNTITTAYLPIDTVKICEGDSVRLVASIPALDFINSNFNNSSLDSGWSTNIFPIWSNPCSPLTLPANGTVCWFGTNIYPRELVTNSFNTMTGNCKLEWDMKYGANQDTINCESPDLSYEGVHLMYSITGGATWIQFPGSDQSPSGIYGDTNYINGSGGYWIPVASNAATGPYYTWNHYYTNLPQAALSSTTRIRWYQELASGNNFDHWGIDNVKFSCGPSLPPFVWSGGNTSITVSPTSTHWYVASMPDTTQNPPGILFDSILVIVQPRPLTPIINIIGDSLYSSSNSGNQWYLNSHPIIGAVGNYYIAADTGNYQLIVSNSSECYSDTSNTITFSIAGKDEQISNSDFFIHPNPANEYFSIQSNKKITEVLILDLNAKVIKKFDQKSYIYNINDLSKGLYFVKIYTKENTRILKLIKY